MTKEMREKVELYMKNLDISEEEAIQLVKDDEEDFIGEEGEAMTEKAKEVKRYEKSTKERKKVVRERKIDPNKVALMDILKNAFSAQDDLTVKNESELSFTYCGQSFTIKLIKHRPPKK